MWTKGLTKAGIAMLMAGVAGAAQPAVDGESDGTDQRYVSVEWPGGRLANYVAHLRQVTRNLPLNVIVDQRAMDWEVQPLELRQVSPELAVRAAQWATDVPTGLMLEIEAFRENNGRDGLLSLVVRGTAPESATREHERTRINVLSIKQLLEALPGQTPPVVLDSETVLTAVQAALEMADDDGNSADVKFHQDSGLLIIRGDAWELEAAERVVDLLVDDIRDRRSYVEQTTGQHFAQRMAEIATASQGDRELQLIELQADLRQAELDLQRRELLVMTAMEDRDRVRQMVEKAFASEAEAREAEIKAQEAELTLQLGRAEVDRMRQRLELVEKRASGEKSPAAMQEELAVAQSRLNELQLRLADAQARSEQMNARRGIDVSQQMLQQVQYECSDLSAQIAQQQAIIAEIEARMSRVQEDESGAAEAGRRLRDDLMELERVNAALNARNEELARSLEMRARESEDLRRRLEALEAQRPR